MRDAIAHLGPSSFIDCVMDGDNGAHVTFARLPAFPLHCIVKHLLARVHPHIAGGILVLWPRVSRCKATCAPLIASIEVSAVLTVMPTIVFVLTKKHAQKYS